MMIYQLEGNAETRQVFLNGKELDPQRSLNVRSHSPDGFNWGYCGSGPAQLALAICLEIFPLHHSMQIYQTFKETIIATIPQGQNFVLTFEVSKVGSFSLN